MFGLLVKQFETQVEKCRWAGNCKFAKLVFSKLEIFNPILKFTYLTASSSRFGALAKAMQCTEIFIKVSVGLPCLTHLHLQLDFPCMEDSPCGNVANARETLPSEYDLETTRAQKYQ